MLYVKNVNVNKCILYVLPVPKPVTILISVNITCNYKYMSLLVYSDAKNERNGHYTSGPTGHKTALIARGKKNLIYASYKDEPGKTWRKVDWLTEKTSGVVAPDILMNTDKTSSIDKSKALILVTFVPVLGCGGPKPGQVMPRGISSQEVLVSIVIKTEIPAKVEGKGALLGTFPINTVTAVFSACSGNSPLIATILTKVTVSKVSKFAMLTPGHVVSKCKVSQATTSPRGT